MQTTNYVGGEWVFRNDKRGSKAKNCTTGDSCGNTCIEQGKVCSVNPNATQKKLINQLFSRIAARAGAVGSAAASRAGQAASAVSTAVREKASQILSKEPKNERPIEIPKTQAEAQALVKQLIAEGEKEFRIEGEDYSNRDNYKPSLSKADAERYISSSKYTRETLHATSSTAAKAIASNGVDTNLAKRSVYGKGFYMAGGDNARSAVQEYLDENDDGRILSLRFDVRNPRVFKDGFMDYTDWEDKHVTPLRNKAMNISDDPNSDRSMGRVDEATRIKAAQMQQDLSRAILKRRGYDGSLVGVDPSDETAFYIVAYDRKQVVTVEG